MNEALFNKKLERLSHRFSEMAEKDVATGSCWEVAAVVSEELRGRTIKVCFCGDPKTCEWEDELHYAQTGLTHETSLYPHSVGEYKSDHRFTLVRLSNGNVMGVDFTARQFDETSEFPLVWKHNG